MESETILKAYRRALALQGDAEQRATIDPYDLDAKIEYVRRTRQKETFARRYLEKIIEQREWFHEHLQKL